ncbi:putative cytochrome P450 [Mollisia scopiformis]|uniref:Putative cytochrome P450 n=1 Tax=Mollisia scopiformis TaxID=149040 RepID=A0A132BBM6_MOLSC|nr:putative cytochrome P450 [Mollisia scopiformis]KUJ09796.1 putative cytochrome P450 [Mollisia scopiformis]
MAVFDTKSSSTLVLLCVGATFCIYRLALYVIAAQRRNKIIRDNGCKPYKNYPHKDPIFGFDLFAENLRLSKTGGVLDIIVDRYARLNTNTFSQLLLGERFINTSEPENVKALLATQFKDFALPSRRKAALGPIFGHGIFTTDGAAWENSRSLLRPNFVRSQIGDLETFEHHVSHLIAKIPRDGSTVDLQPLFFCLTMDSATEFLFGQSTNTLLEGETSATGEKFADAFTYATETAGLTARVGKLANLFPNKRYEDSVKFVHDFVGNYVQSAIDMRNGSFNGEKKAEEGKKYIFLEELAKTGVGKKQIQDELLNVLLAGRDTTASLLAYIFHILARRPDVFAKLRAEVETLGSERPSFEQIKSLKYLQYTLNEVLRLHPIVPANSRTAVRDTTLPLGGGPDGKSPIFVKKGQMVNYQVYVMQRRKDLYGPDADEFKPERWEQFRPSWQYLPFNGGPRICIGQQFALTEASYTTIRLLQSFKDIAPRGEDAPLLEILTLTNAVRGGVPVSLTPA